MTRLIECCCWNGRRNPTWGSGARAAELRTETGESPYACACREAAEELQVKISASDLHLAGMVSEHGYAGQSHWLMFLFEVKTRFERTPPRHREGRFDFFPRADLDRLKLPQTDRERIWPWFWEFRGGFFAAHCHCRTDGRNDWTLEEFWKAPLLESP